MSPKISFLVPAYNYGRYLAECLGSIFCLDGEQDFEVIVVDDASVDTTQQVLTGFSDPRLRIRRHEHNLGHVATMNEALATSTGEFVARIDPDDRYRRRFLVETLPHFADPQVGMVYGDAALIDEYGRVTAPGSDTVHGGQDYSGNELVSLLEHNFVCAPTAIARREAWLAARPVPAWLAFNDWYFNVEIARRYKSYFVASVLADYRVHGTNHHMRIIRDRSEEASTMWILDRVFNERESDMALEARKQVARRRIYASQYLTLADKYFGCGLLSDARRCYLQAARFRPSVLLDRGVERRLAGTLLGKRAYEAVKARFRAQLAQR